MTSPTTQAQAREAVEQIQAALAKLPPDADSPWMNLDKMPYIHATDDPKASPWSCAVVGRFDYLQTMGYMLACQPSNIRAVLALLAAKQEELDKMRADAERYRWLREHCDSMSLNPPLTVAKVTGWGLEGWSGDDLNSAIDAARAALSPIQVAAHE